MTQSKSLQRRRGLEARKALSPREAAENSAALCRRLTEGLLSRPPGLLLSYAPFGSEADVTPFNRAAGARGWAVAYPVCLGGGVMRAAVPLSPDAWEVGPHGIRAPVLSSSRLVEPEELELVIVPCAAFDARCRRTGMGAGYYDRYLPRCRRALWVAAAFEVQRAEDIVQDPWDVPLHAVATEAAWYGTPPG